MKLLSNKNFSRLSPATSRREAHCLRVAALADEIGRTLSLPYGALFLRSVACLHDCPIELIPEQAASHVTPSQTSSNFNRLNPRDRLVAAIRTLQRGQTSLDHGIAMAVEVVRLANSFDEMIEWLPLESRTMNEILHELSVMNGLPLWRPAVEAALHEVCPDLLLEAVTAGDRLPISAFAAIRKMATIPTADLTIEVLQQTAASDPVLAAHLLRIVNSWGITTLRGRISSIRDATLQLGVQRVRSILLAAAGKSLFASSALQELWQHTLKVAGIAADLSTMCGYDSNEAFIAGLLHDVGRLALEKLGPETSERRMRLLEQQVPLVWVDLVTCRHDHGMIGGALLKKWNLPPGVVEAVSLHHWPERTNAMLPSILHLAEQSAGESEDIHSKVKSTHALQITGLCAADVSRCGNGAKTVRDLDAIIAS